MTRIEVSGVSRFYGDRRAVDDVTFVVGEGTITGLLGPNGSGKSTLIRRMLDIDPGPGSTWFDGTRYRDLPSPLATVGAVLDAGGMHPGMRVRRHLRAVASAYGIPVENIDDVLAATGIAAAGRLLIGQLSLGMRQRLALAAAFLCRPRVLILDEPTNGLDPHGVRWLSGYLRAYAADGGTVLMSSHMIGDVELLADKVVVISRGRKVAEGTARSIVSELGRPAVLVRSTEPEDLAARLVKAGAVLTSRSDGAVEVRGLEPEAVAHVAASGLGIVLELHVESVKLEDAYLEIARVIA